MSQAVNYVHWAGIHCESACLRNILAAGGHDVAEEDVFGLDGGFGFSFFPTNGDSPDIVVGKQEIMPLRAARLMGVEVEAKAPKSSAGLSKLVEAVPAVMARVDIGLLPHWGLEGRSSFGGYFVNVVRVIDGGFEISDAAMDDPVTIAASDLDAARSSRATPPLNPNHQTFTFGEPSTDLRLELVGPVAVRNLCRNVLKPGSRSLGVPGLRTLQAAARKWPETKQGVVEDVDLSGRVSETTALGRQLLHFGRQIESFGTGGGLYRPMIGRFLARVGEAADTNADAYLESADLFVASGEHWHKLGVALLAHGLDGSPSELQDLVDGAVDTTRIAMDLEKRALSTVVAL